MVSVEKSQPFTYSFIRQIKEINGKKLAITRGFNLPKT